MARRCLWCSCRGSDMCQTTTNTQKNQINHRNIEAVVLREEIACNVGGKVDGSRLVLIDRHQSLFSVIYII